MGTIRDEEGEKGAQEEEKRVIEEVNMIQVRYMQLIKCS
jgi:hypothetical protein